MKNKYLMIVVFILVATALIAAGKTDLEAYKLKGKVQNMGTESTIYHFNYDGYLEMESYDWGYRYGDIYYEYDEQGRLSHVNDIDEYGDVIYETWYIYNDQGLLAEKKNVDEYYEYNTRHEYDARGNVIWTRHFIEDTTPLSAVEYVWDKKGRKIRENSYDAEMVMTDYITYKYDKKGNIIQQLNYEAPKKLSYKTLSKYNKQNQLIRETQYTGKVQMYIQDIAYNSLGDVIQRKTYYPKEKKTSLMEITYNYDDQGNWIMMLGTRDGIEEEPTYREINYYTED